MRQLGCRLLRTATFPPLLLLLLHVLRAVMPICTRCVVRPIVLQELFPSLYVPQGNSQGAQLPVAQPLRSYHFWRQVTAVCVPHAACSCSWSRTLLQGLRCCTSRCPSVQACCLLLRACWWWCGCMVGEGVASEDGDENFVTDVRVLLEKGAQRRQRVVAVSCKPGKLREISRQVRCFKKIECFIDSWLQHVEFTSVLLSACGMHILLQGTLSSEQQHRTCAGHKG
ncbi:hypothetical protein COO60DRAFT_1565073, partial [Scenedesmus sp. NREL 46B-D3]